MNKNKIMKTIFTIFSTFTIPIAIAGSVVSCNKKAPPFYLWETFKKAALKANPNDILKAFSRPQLDELHWKKTDKAEFDIYGGDSVTPNGYKGMQGDLKANDKTRSITGIISISGQGSYFHSHPIAVYINWDNMTPYSSKNWKILKGLIAQQGRDVLSDYFKPTIDSITNATDLLSSNLQKVLKGFGWDGEDLRFARSSYYPAKPTVMLQQQSTLLIGVLNLTWIIDNDIRKFMSAYVSFFDTKNETHTNAIGSDISWSTFPYDPPNDNKFNY